MVQNVFTFTHRFQGKQEGEEYDFSGTISKLASEGWRVKQISTSAYTLGSPFVVLTVLAEKAK